MKYGGHLKQWARRGFPELGDTHGVGLGATTTHVMKHPQFDTEPYKVRSRADDVRRAALCDVVVHLHGTIVCVKLFAQFVVESA